MAGSADSYEQLIADAREEEERLARERREEPEPFQGPATIEYNEYATYGEGETVAEAEKAALAAYRGGLGKDQVKVLDDGAPRTATFVDMTVEAALKQGQVELGPRARILEVKSTPPETRVFPLKARSRQAARRLAEKIILPAVEKAFGKMALKQVSPIYKLHSSSAFLPWYLRWKKKTYRIEMSGRAGVEIRYQMPAQVRVHFAR